MKKKRDRISVCLSPNQLLVLSELKEALSTNYSLLIKAIISDFLTRNEDTLERIITANTKENADNQYTTEKIFN